MPDPVPGPGEVLVDMKATAVNFPDLLVIEGKYQIIPPHPFVPGKEAPARWRRWARAWRVFRSATG